MFKIDVFHYEIHFCHIEKEIVMETYTLSNTLNIPKIGFGTWQLTEGEEAYKAVTHALKVVLILLRFMVMNIVLDVL